MFKFRTSARLACCVGFLASGAVWLSLAVGVLPNPDAKLAARRTMTARYVSMIAASMVSDRQEKRLQEVLEKFVAAEESLISVNVQTSRGVLISAGTDSEGWESTDRSSDSNAGQSSPKKAVPDKIQAELLSNGRRFGTIEFAFQTNAAKGLLGAMMFPVPLAIFVGGLVSLFSWAIFARAFRYLDPSQVVPGRVRSALNTMAEGLVLLDENFEIGHANSAFERIMGIEARDLLGHSIETFEWKQSSDFGSDVLPWTQCLEEQQPVCGMVVDLIIDSQPTRKFIVNATPIVSDTDRCRGILVSLDDVTLMEEKKHELSQVIKTLRQSRDEISRKNEQLEFFASYDQLTECLNRREYFLRSEAYWADGSLSDLSVIMIDVDHFKRVNDNHGHGTGDEVLRGIASVLRDCVGERGLVARLGGEEFVVLMPGIGINAATLIGEEIRQKVNGKPIGGLAITISVGVSSREMKAMDSQHLLDQADQALYVGKECGRNCVVRFDERHEVEAAYAKRTDLAEVAMANEEADANEIVQEVGQLAEQSRMTGLNQLALFNADEAAKADTSAR